MNVSDDLINVFADMATMQTIKYIPLEKATKYELGVEGIQTDPHIVKDDVGNLHEVPGHKLVDADTSSDLRCALAMQRLGLAADMAHVSGPASPAMADLGGGSSLCGL